MNPTTVCCPNLACPARGQTGQGNIGIHSRQEKRFICTQCRKTFTTTQGTALYRLRTSTEMVARVVTLMAHGCPLQAIVVAFGVDERTRRGLVAAGRCPRPRGPGNIWSSNEASQQRYLRLIMLSPRRTQSG